MKQIKIMMFSKRKIKRNLIIIATSFLSIYLLISMYFFNHFFLHTEINGMNVSLKNYDKLSDIINDYIRNYELKLIERDGETEVITNQDINLRHNNASIISQAKHLQNPFLWIGSLWRNNRFYIKELFQYDRAVLDNKINQLKCLNKKFTEPRNVDFIYTNGSYKIVKEIDGNKINKTRFTNIVNQYISEGRRNLDLSLTHCYEEPIYKVGSKKTLITKNRLNQYVSAKIIYRFGNASEQLNGTLLHQWLRVDENLDVTISKEDIRNYIRALGKKYDTVGIKREFQTSTGKTVELQGGLYGWKIDQNAETQALYKNINQAEVIEKEPIYLQKAFSREGNEIGSTYIEINITRQHLWFYKDGTLITQGAVVTGNPNRGNATVLGAYMVNYKQKNATLTGADYEAKVTYWIPFFGNIGLHDATWRHRFGGEIYLTRGSHGCVNAPFYLVKTIFKYIEEGTPVIIYEE